MRKAVILILTIFCLSGCKSPSAGEKSGKQNPEAQQVEEKAELVTFNQVYNLTFSPINVREADDQDDGEEVDLGDPYSYLILLNTGTFSMSVNTCDGVDTLQGDYFIEDQMLYLIPEYYYCDLETEECNVRGMKFIINNPRELTIVNGTRCICEGSVFTVE